MSSFASSCLPDHKALVSCRGRLKELNAQRSALEIEADAIASALNSPGVNGEPPAGVKNLLVDREGFPRADIDIMHVMTQRNRLAIINTDHKLLMAQIEKELMTLHSLSSNAPDEVLTPLPASSTNSSSSNSSSSSSSSNNNTGNGGRAWAVIDEILSGSPASIAGLVDGDELIAFGYIEAESSDALASVPALVGASVNRGINVIVRRQQASLTASGEAPVMVSLTLTPKVWGGRGLLGCHLTPIPMPSR